MEALLIVDLQNDFCPGGALEVENADTIVPTINQLAEKFELVVASKDWHPPKSIHFEKWPVHCVRNTPGAEFHPSLTTEAIEEVFLKGTEDKDDGYSAFEATNKDLAQYLRKRGVDTIFIVGLTTDYCVKETAIDCAKNGFKTKVVRDAIKAVNAGPGDGEKALKAMQRNGCELISVHDILNQ
ncbi:MAG: nicotinamidase [Saprospirales bacterium]|nr:MAG: nicotinamidase [Saprospirales bacterium]